MIMITIQDDLGVQGCTFGGVGAYVKLREAPRFQREWSTAPLRQHRPIQDLGHLYTRLVIHTNMRVCVMG